jgi:hypothetical protein
MGGKLPSDGGYSGARGLTYHVSANYQIGS